jgi:hypothetical protein
MILGYIVDLVANWCWFRTNAGLCIIDTMALHEYQIATPFEASQEHLVDLEAASD